jgi:hypothetical protein
MTNSRQKGADRAVANELAERHERLVVAAKRAQHGDKLRLQAMARAALHDRMRAELAVDHD